MRRLCDDMQNQGYLFVSWSSCSRCSFTPEVHLKNQDSQGPSNSNLTWNSEICKCKSVDYLGLGFPSLICSHSFNFLLKSSGISFVISSVVWKFADHRWHVLINPWCWSTAPCCCGPPRPSWLPTLPPSAWTPALDRPPGQGALVE